MRNPSRATSVDVGEVEDGHNTHLNELRVEDLTTFHKQMAELSGVAFGGVR